MLSDEHYKRRVRQASCGILLLPSPRPQDDISLEFHSFWAEGVALCSVASAGFAANLVSVHILTRRDVRSFFSNLLVRNY